MNYINVFFTDHFHSLLLCEVFFDLEEFLKLEENFSSFLHIDPNNKMKCHSFSRKMLVMDLFLFFPKRHLLIAQKSQ